MNRNRALTLVVALVLSIASPAAIASAAPPDPTAAPVGAELPGASGSAIGPGGDLFVASPASGTIYRIDRHTHSVDTFHEGLPPQVPPLGGVTDLAFQGDTAYSLVTLVGPDVGGDDTVGIYRLDTSTTATPIADLGTWSQSHPPSTDFFVPSGVQYAIHPSGAASS